MDEKLDMALMAAEKDVRGAAMMLESAREAAERGDLNAALVELHMGLFRRLEDARIEAEGAVERLVELGGKYPPPQD